MVVTLLIEQSVNCPEFKVLNPGAAGTEREARQRETNVRTVVKSK